MHTIRIIKDVQKINVVLHIININLIVMKTCFLAIFLFCSIQIFAQSKTEKEIISILKIQDEAWNTGDINGFMETYWKNDSLMFIGKSGVTYGWQNTLNNYKKGYPDTTTMGKLNFTLIDIKKLSRKYYHVVGKWHLTRSIGDLQGHFTILMQKIKGKWYIIADHSS
jgi:ketosteroid isomerase-like protein